MTPGKKMSSGGIKVSSRPRRTPDVEVLESRTLLATDVRASARLFYTNADTQAQFGAVDNGIAIFEGGTTNTSATDNMSLGYWSGGQLVLGQFGTVDFQSTAVDPRHRNYFVALSKAAGADLSGLTATVHGRDGNNHPVDIPLVIPDQDIGSQSDAARPIQVIAPQHPDDNTSSLSPSVLQNFIRQDIASALRDLESRVHELNQGHPELVSDAIGAAGYAASVHDALITIEAIGGSVGFEIALQSLGPAALLVDAAEELGIWYVQSQLRDNVKNAIQRVDSDFAIASTLAEKTFFPDSIDVSGVSNSPGFGGIVIGGPFQQYSNDFQFPIPGMSTGTSTFSGPGTGLPVSGSIVTQNYYDPSGIPLFANSTLTLGQGITLFRKLVVTGPLVANSDGSTTFDSEFQFTQIIGPSGSLSQGLNGFQATGDVSAATGQDGRPEIQFSGDATSSLATAVTIPDGQSALVIDTSFLSDLQPFGDATFSTDFTHDGLTTHLSLDRPFDPGEVGNEIRREVLQIPDDLRGQTGILQFTFDPSSPLAPAAIRASVLGQSSTDGLTLYGFDLVSIPANQPPVLDPIADQTIQGGGTVSFIASATDPDGDGPPSFSLDAAPDGAVIDPTTGRFSWTPTDFEGPGAYTVTVRSSDNGSPSASGTETFSITVAKSAPTATETLTANSTSPIYGRALTFTALVSAGAGGGTPTGTVQFEADGTPFGSAVVLAHGSATSPNLSTLAAGKHTITAVYSGDADFATTSTVLSLTIAKAPLKIVANSPTKVTGRANPPLLVTYSGFVLGQGAANLAGALTVATTATASSAPGSYPVTPGGLTSANYAITYVDGTMTVAPKITSYAAVVSSLANPTYGQSLFFGTTVGAFPGFGTPTGTIQFVLDGSNFGAAVAMVNGAAFSPGIATLGAGVHHVSAIYSGNANYAAFASPIMTLTTAKAPLKVVANSATKVYGRANPPIFAAGLGFVLGQGMANLAGVLNVATTANVGSHVGSYPVTPGGLTSANYAITYVGGTMVVTPAPLTITADGATRAYDQPNPLLTASYSGFVNGDTPASLTTPVVLWAAANPFGPVGTYAISAWGASSPDYAIAFRNGSLAVTPPPAGASPITQKWSAFATTLYEEILGRNPDPGGLAFWVQMLNRRVPPSTVALDIWNSPEHILLLMTNRAPQIALASALQDAMTAGQVAFGLASTLPQGPLSLASASWRGW